MALTEAAALEKIALFMAKRDQCTQPDSRDWFLAKAFALWQLLGYPEEQFHGHVTKQSSSACDKEGGPGMNRTSALPGP